MGRFLNADSLGGETGDLGSHNIFVYCLNNPVNLTDDTGNWPKWLETAAKVVAAVAVVATAVVVVAAVTAATAGAGTVALASIAFATATAGFVGGIANERKNESFINGWCGGAANGLIQSTATIAFGGAGTAVGGGVGSGIGTYITESMNNIGKSKSQRTSQGEILSSSAKSAVVGTVLSTATAGINVGVSFAQSSQFGYNSWLNMIKADANAISPITPGYGEMLKGFLGAVDDGMVYIFTE